MLSSLSCFMGSLGANSYHLTGSLRLHSGPRWGKSKVGQIPGQAGCHPFQLGLSAAAAAPRIWQRLIRWRQDTQGRASECSVASAAVVELNFLISRIPLCCQERKAPPSLYAHPLSSWLNSQASWSSEVAGATGAIMFISGPTIAFDATIDTGNYSLCAPARSCCFKADCSYFSSQAAINSTPCWHGNEMDSWI